MQALNVYKELLANDDPDPLYYIYAAACYYYMGLYKEAEETALQVRVLRGRWGACVAAATACGCSGQGCGGGRTTACRWGEGAVKNR